MTRRKAIALALLAAGVAMADKEDKLLKVLHQKAREQNGRKKITCNTYEKKSQSSFVLREQKKPRKIPAWRHRKHCSVGEGVPAVSVCWCFVLSRRASKKNRPGGRESATKKKVACAGAIFSLEGTQLAEPGKKNPKKRTLPRPGGGKK